MSRMLLLFSTAFLLFAIGCQNDPFSDNQSPLDDQPEHVRNAKPKVEKPKGPPPVNPNVLAFWVDGPLAFAEGVESQIRFKGAVKEVDPLIPTGFRLEIAELAEIMPGATFERATDGSTDWILTWTPQDDEVRWTDLYTSFNVDIRMISEEQTKASISRQYPVYVTRAVDNPEVISLGKFPPTEFYENYKGYYGFKVTVRDPESDRFFSDKSFAPRLDIVRVTSGSEEGSRFIRQYDVSQDRTDPQLWNYDLRLEVFGNITASKINLKLGFIAINRFGRSSVLKPASYQVITTVPKPEITWQKEKLTLTSGETYVSDFQVYAPQEDGEIEVNFDQFCGGLPGQASCKCEYVSKISKATMQCRFAYTPDSTVRLNMQKFFYIKNNNPYRKDFKEAQVFRQITIEPAPVPPTLPPTDPNPPTPPGSGTAARQSKGDLS